MEGKGAEKSPLGAWGFWGVLGGGGERKGASQKRETRAGETPKKRLEREENFAKEEKTVEKRKETEPAGKTISADKTKETKESLGSLIREVDTGREVGRARNARKTKDGGEKTTKALPPRRPAQDGSRRGKESK